ncbi:MAG TPA: histidine phosphatase family protein [Polyangiales bacterium]|nr:histidine phosphatase family protein [Polyangiales bacterium]
MVPGAEHPESVVARMRRALERAVEHLRGRHESALVVGHGSATRMFVESLTGKPELPLGNVEFREIAHDGSSFSLL